MKEDMHTQAEEFGMVGCSSNRMLSWFRNGSPQLVKHSKPLATQSFPLILSCNRMERRIGRTKGEDQDISNTMLNFIRSEKDFFSANKNSFPKMGWISCF